MTVTHMEFSPRFGAHRPGLFRKRTRDALADLMAQRFPFGRRGHVKKTFKATDDQARAICRGNPSWETFDQVLDEGGWSLALELLAIRFGEGVEQHLERERRRHAEQAQQLGAILRPVGSRPADGGHLPDPVGAERARLVPREDRRLGGGEV